MNFFKNWFVKKPSKQNNEGNNITSLPVPEKKKKILAGHDLDQWTFLGYTSSSHAYDDFIVYFFLDEKTDERSFGFLDKEQRRIFER